MLSKNYYKMYVGGYSVIELLVAMTLFITVVAIASGATLSLMRSNSEIRQNQQLANSMDIMMEDIVRNLRVGYSYAANGSRIRFSNDVDPDFPNKRICIGLSNNVLRIWRQQQGSGPSDCPANSSSLWSNLSSDNIVVTAFNFNVYGQSTTDDVQPHVRIFIQAASVENPTKVISYQTIVTQRRYDN